MKIQKIKIENLGKIDKLQIEMKKDVLVIPYKEYKDVAKGLAEAVSNTYLSMITPIEIKKDSLVECVFQCENKNWKAVATFNPNYKEEIYKGRVVVNGRPLRHEYFCDGVNQNNSSLLSKFHISIDENDIFVFRNNLYLNFEIPSQRWCRFFDLSTFFEPFKIIKEDNEEFAYGIREFIKQFKPVAMDISKNLYVTLNENNTLIPTRINNGIYEQVKNLSQSDTAVFNYVCFIIANNAIFYALSRIMPGFYFAKKPLFLFNFVEYLDQSVDISFLLNMATDMGCQVFLFTGGYEMYGLKSNPLVQTLD